MKKSLLPFKYQVCIYDDPSRSGYPDRIFYFDHYDAFKDFLSCNDVFALVFEFNQQTLEYDKIVGETRVIYEDLP